MTLSWFVVASWAALTLLVGVLWRRPGVTLAVFAASLLPPLLACLEASGVLSNRLQFEHPLLTGTGLVLALLWQRRSRRAGSVRPRTAAVFAVALACGSLAAGGMKVRTPSRDLSVLVAIDRSRSAELSPRIKHRLELEWQLLKQSVGREHELGVVDFAARAHLTARPKRGEQLRLRSPPELPTGATNLEAAIRSALTVLPADGSGRIVLVTDGRETRGSVESGLLAARRQRVAVNVVPLERPHLPNLRVDRVTGPLVVHTGEAFDLRVVLESPEPMEVGFELLANGETVDQGHLSLKGGQDVVRFGLRAGSTSLTRYALRCWATLRSQDQIQDDNEGATFVQVLGRSSALVVSQNKTPALSDVLAHGAFEIAITTPERAPQSPLAWAAYDLVVLEGFPAELFHPDQLSTLAAAVEHLGTGLVLFGSGDGLGPGGYGFTPLERMSPVSFDVAHERKRGRVDLTILVDASASMAAKINGQMKLALAHSAVLATADALASDDQLAIAHVNQNLAWTLPLGAPPVAEKLIPLLQEIEPLGSGIRADVALRQTYPTLRTSQAHVKHVVLLVDADDVEGAMQSIDLVKSAAATGITTSVVSLGMGRNAEATKRLALFGRGRHFAVEALEQLPAVLVRETLAASHNPVREVLIQVRAEPTAVTQGIDFSSSPALGGYVATLPKPRSTVHLRSPDSAPILASWSIGLGQMAVFASDYGGRWGAAWTRWAGAAQLLLQTARLVTRPTAASGLLARALPSEGRLQVSVDVLGGIEQERGPFSARVVTPDGEFRDTALLDRGNGRFASELPLETSGTYLVSITNQRSGKVRATTGVEVGVGDELSTQGTDLASLRRLAERGNGVLLEHVAGVFARPPPNVYTAQSVSVPLLWLTAILMLVGLTLSQQKAPSAYKGHEPGASSAIPSTTEIPPAHVPPVPAVPLGPHPPTSAAELLLARRSTAHRATRSHSEGDS